MSVKIKELIIHDIKMHALEHFIQKLKDSAACYCIHTEIVRAEVGPVRPKSKGAALLLGGLQSAIAKVMHSIIVEKIAPKLVAKLKILQVEMECNNELMCDFGLFPIEFVLELETSVGSYLVTITVMVGIASYKENNPLRLYLWLLPALVTLLRRALAPWWDTPADHSWGRGASRTIGRSHPMLPWNRSDGAHGSELPVALRGEAQSSISRRRDAFADTQNQFLLPGGATVSGLRPPGVSTT